MGQTIWEQFAEPFTDDELDWRVQNCGKNGDKVWAIIVPYLQARPVMDRLDAVIGPEGWKDEYKPVHFGQHEGFTCRLWLRPRVDGNWIFREDGAPLTGVEAIKGGHSDAFKRTAVKVGMGRYLYGFPTVFATGITDQRPQDTRGWVNIYSKKDGISSWCPSPKQSTLGVSVAPVINREKMILRIRELEKKHYPVPQAVEAAHKKYLHSELLESHSDEILLAYGKYLSTRGEKPNDEG